jgi:pimeloyl-ACP methyl ester carboxylesterase
MTRRIYGLLVGIDDYPTPVPKLEGCVNDVNAIEDYLRNRLDTNQYQLHLQRLTTNGQDEKPTRKAVIAGFEQHLCQATEQDVALFYYSGHGSQEPAPPEFWHLEPERMDETLVCWDSRTTDWDLADKELAYLIAQVAKNNPHIIIILDCCHSGSGTRDIVPEKGVRHASADRRARSLEDFIFSLPDLEAISIGAASEGTVDEPSGWNLPVGRHIVLSGCRDSELASEYSGDGQQRGAFSYFLLDTLQKTNGSLTYRELFKRASTLVRSRIKDQSPQLESTLQEDLELPFLGSEGAIAPSDPYFTLSYENNRWVIDAGAVHGIPQNTMLALYPLGTTVEQRRQLSASVGEAEVIEVRPHQSVVEIITAPNDLTPDTVLNAVITSLPLPPLGVYFEGDAEALNAVRQELQKIGIGGKPSLYVREVEKVAEAQYRLLAHESQYLITKPSDRRPLVRQLEGYNEANARKAVENLEHIARWTAVVQLEGTPGSRLPANAVTMQFYLPDSTTEILNSTLRLSYQYQGGKWKPPTFRLKLTNTSEERLFCTVLVLGETYSVSAPLFEGNNRGVWIEPGAEVWAFRKKEIPASVPEELWKQGVTEYQDVLKLIVSTAEFDASLMCQEGLERPKLGTRSVPKRNSTLNRLMQRVTTRDIGVAQIDEVDEWLTSQVTVITVRPRDTVSVQQDAPTDIGMGVTLQPHPSLQATARLTTVSQSTRDVGGQILPPILRDNSQPFQFTASRGVDPGLSALELKITDANTLNAVTPEQPLTLLVDKALGDNEYVLPVAYDGEFFIPLGRGEAKDGKTEIRLERLIDPLEEKKRSLGGSIRIFFQKIVAEKLGLEFPYPILAAVEHGADGTNRYEGSPEIVTQKVAQANKIVLFIHGIIGDTQSIVPCASLAKIDLDGQENSLTDIYDLVLAFDYENLNTPIGTLAEQLGERLKSVGLGANHGKTLHIVAHSMGGLVSRSFIEQKGGDRVVQHLIMLGTPNAGSPWSTVQDWAFTALTIGLNGLSVSGFPLAALGNLLGGIEAIDINLDQMKPGSDFLTSLRDCADPGVPYTILAGNTSLIPPPDGQTAKKLQTLLGKLGRGAIEFPFLGQPNDIAVTVHSIKSVPTGRSRPPRIQEVACNHLVYFTHAEGLQALAEAVISTGILTVAIPLAASSATPDITPPTPPPSPALTPDPAASEAPHTTPTPSSGATPVPIRPNTQTSEGIPMWLIGLVAAILVGIGGGFWIWQQQSNPKAPSPQNTSSP